MSKVPIDNSLLKQLGQNFQLLQHKLAQVVTNITITDANLPVYFVAPAPLAHVLPHRLAAAQFIKQIEYLDTQHPKETILGPGILAASSSTLVALSELNQAKEAFKQVVLEIKKLNIAVHDSVIQEYFETILPQRVETVASSLKKLGMARLNLKQCYRTIPLFNHKPLSVAWTWAHTKAITKINVTAARNKLLELGHSPNIEWQLARLDLLAETEQLAIIQELAPHLRANITFSGNTGYYRIMVKGPVPFFYPYNPEEPELPKIKAPKAKQVKDASRPIRKDVKIEEEPYLPALRAHRYLQRDIV